MMKLLRITSVLAFVLASLPASGSPANAAQDTVRVRIVTAAGTIVVALDQKHAPKTVANFLRYVDRKFYDGGSFFRGYPKYLIQGGNQAKAKPSDPTVEFEPSILTGIHNTEGAISMPHKADPNTASSEFFICDADMSRGFDGGMTLGGYAAFGHVVSGMDVVHKIARMKAKLEKFDKPVKIIRIERV